MEQAPGHRSSKQQQNLKDVLLLTLVVLGLDEDRWVIKEAWRRLRWLTSHGELFNPQNDRISDFLDNDNDDVLFNPPNGNS